MQHLSVRPLAAAGRARVHPGRASCRQLRATVVASYQPGSGSGLRGLPPAGSPAGMGADAPPGRLDVRQHDGPEGLGPMGDAAGPLFSLVRALPAALKAIKSQRTEKEQPAQQRERDAAQRERDAAQREATLLTALQVAQREALDAQRDINELRAALKEVQGEAAEYMERLAAKEAGIARLRAQLEAQAARE